MKNLIHFLGFCICSVLLSTAWAKDSKGFDLAYLDWNESGSVLALANTETGGHYIAGELDGGPLHVGLYKIWYLQI